MRMLPAFTPPEPWQVDRITVSRRAHAYLVADSQISEASSAGIQACIHYIAFFQLYFHRHHRKPCSITGIIHGDNSSPFAAGCSINFRCREYCNEEYCRNLFYCREHQVVPVLPVNSQNVGSGLFQDLNPSIAVVRYVNLVAIDGYSGWSLEFGRAGTLFSISC